MTQLEEEITQCYERDFQRAVFACKNIAAQHRLKYVQLTPDHPGYQVDYAASSGDEIFMCEYTTKNMYLMCFFHELGHCLINKRGWKADSKLEQEIQAWNEGMEQMINRCVGLEITYPMIRFMLDNIKTYIKQ